MEKDAYIDDRTILDTAELWRRIPKDWAVLDENQGGWRVSSAAFDDSRDGSPLSVLLAEEVATSGRTAAGVLAPFQNYFLASISAGTARSNQQGVARTPTDEEPAHASVFGKKTGAVKSALAKSARWVIAPKAPYGARQ